ncbi:MAG: hypothetical protein AB8F26_08385 [Phycisphaerales bacterium]
MKPKHVLASTLAAAVFGFASTASGVDIINESSFTVVVSVQDNGLLARTLAPGQTTTFNLTSGSPTDDRIVEISTPGSTSVINSWEAHVSADRDGTVYIREQPRPANWGGIPNPYAEGFTVGGNPMDVAPPRADSLFRSVHFLASSDCQFCPPCSTGLDLTEAEKVAIPNATNQLMCSLVGDGTGYRGVVMAGDLTQFSGIGHTNAYKASVAGSERNVFDGLGNHDVDGTSSRVLDFVRDRKRSTMRSAFIDPLPHYSWDWHDVHFVQLNVFPGNMPHPDKPEINPMSALAFLEADLANHVGDSGRPIVLIQHYGVDSFARNGWWTDAQIDTFWDALDGYNVVLIINGHIHFRPGASEFDRQVDFDEDGFFGRPSIPVFNVGAGRHGAFTEIAINSVNQIRMQVFDHLGAPYSDDIFQFTAPIYVDAASGAEGYGWKDDPFGQIELGLIAKFYPEDLGTPHDPTRARLTIAPGNYDERLTINEAVLLQPNAPGSIVIGRP